MEWEVDIDLDTDDMVTDTGMGMDIGTDIIRENQLTSSFILTRIPIVPHLV